MSLTTRNAARNGTTQAAGGSGGHEQGDRSQPVLLKFGGSVLVGPERLADAAAEIRRVLQQGRPVVAVVSAFKGRTDELLARAWVASGGAESFQGHALAQISGQGELEAAALLALALRSAGIEAEALTPQEIGLVAEGEPTSAEPRSVNGRVIEDWLAAGRVVVLPGFVATTATGRPVTLGRGGSDLTAVFVGDAIGAEVRLVKDVGSVFEREPTSADGAGRAYGSLTWADALALPERAIQPAATRLGAQLDRPFRFVGLGSDEGTLVGADATAFAGEVAVGVA
ncbi:MAG: hypothetical protein AAF747_03525 [Planctomycetota bacterium]